MSDGTADGIAAEVKATTAVLDRGTSFESIAVPSELASTLAAVVMLGDEARAFYEAAAHFAATGDAVDADGAVDQDSVQILRIARAWQQAGAPCDETPSRLRTAQLTVPLDITPNQIGAGFGSIWVSDRSGDRVVRLDPATGTLQATIEVGRTPLKMQPADGSMWVRTVAAYVRIDPSRDTVSATLAKTDVGPTANRSWAVDGALWICDGRRIHRYDPTTVSLMATLNIDVDCGQIYATSDLVVAWSYNENNGESRNSAAAFIDPATNTVLRTVALPVDVGVPVVLPGSVLFAGYGGSHAVVVDRATWTVTATPDLGRTTAGSMTAFAGNAIYVCTFDEQEILQIDSSTFTVTKTIKPLDAHSVVVDNGALWVTSGSPVDVIQRFAID